MSVSVDKVLPVGRMNKTKMRRGCDVAYKCRHLRPRCDLLVTRTFNTPGLTFIVQAQQFNPLTSHKLARIFGFDISINTLVGTNRVEVPIYGTITARASKLFATATIRVMFVADE
jgi:hypothetical protein